jgi:AcrR family transcriptional regulator
MTDHQSVVILTNGQLLDSQRKYIILSDNHKKTSQISKKRIVKDPDVRYTELIDIAELLFIERGYDGTTVDDIVEKAKVAKGTFYYYFKSKDQILDAMLLQYQREVLDIVENVTFKMDLNAGQKMLEILASFRGMTQPKKKRIIDFIHEERNAALHLKHEKKFISQITPYLTKIVNQGIREGLFHTDYAKEASFTILTITSALSNYALHKHLTREGRERVWKIYLKFIERILDAESGIFSSKKNLKKKAR